MKLIFVLILLISSNYIFSNSKWELTHFVDDIVPIGVVCKDSLNCYVLSTHAEGKLLMFKSTDQGVSWYQIWETLDFKAQVDNKVKYKVWDSFDFTITPKGTIIIGALEGSYLLKTEDDCKTFDTIFFSFDHSILNIEMFGNNIGFAQNGHVLYTTKNCWRTFESKLLNNENAIGGFPNPHFLNDSIFVTTGQYMVGDRIPEDVRSGFIKYNFKQATYEAIPHERDPEGLGFIDFKVIRNGDYFTIGHMNNGVGHQRYDIIYKSTDKGTTWEEKLFKEHYPIFGLQDIAFKNDKVGIAVGQYGKILYTYDGGDTWIYEITPHDSMKLVDNHVFDIAYAGEVAILIQYNGHFYRMAYDPDDYTSVDADKNEINMIIEDWRIRFQGILNHNSEISIFNLEGITKYTGTYKDFVPISDFISGVYIVNLTQNNRIIYSNKFIISN